MNASWQAKMSIVLCVCMSHPAIAFSCFAFILYVVTFILLRKTILFPCVLFDTRPHSTTILHPPNRTSFLTFSPYTISICLYVYCIICINYMDFFLVRTWMVFNLNQMDSARPFSGLHFMHLFQFNRFWPLSPSLRLECFHYTVVFRWRSRSFFYFFFFCFVLYHNNHIYISTCNMYTLVQNTHTYTHEHAHEHTYVTY